MAASWKPFDCAAVPLFPVRSHRELPVMAAIYGTVNRHLDLLKGEGLACALLRYHGGRRVQVQFLRMNGLLPS